MKKIFTIIALSAICSFASFAQSVEDFEAVGDSLSTLIREKTTIKGSVQINKIVKRKGNKLDIYFGQSLSDFPWKPDQIEWLRNEITAQMPQSCEGLSLGEIYAKNINIKELETTTLSNDGKPSAFYKYRYPRKKAIEPFITKVDERSFKTGLDGRYIALWQSHGRYFEAKTNRWEWQRAPIQRTVEDMYTQSYVIPFLIPMLENAGAYVLTPRERDINRQEYIMDNDPSFEERCEGDRLAGEYCEEGNWDCENFGFADAKRIYTRNDNPFTMGTVRITRMAKTGKDKSLAVWTPDIRKRGEYAVYISYKTMPNSTKCAHYTVRHMAGTSEFIVNQQKGGETWIYLGTFEFAEGTGGCVTLDNLTPEGYRYVKNSVVTADAVKIGGGMGKIARGLDDVPVEEYVTSGLPSFTEGAMYWMQWAGCDSTVTADWEDDYTKDYASRGAWVNMMRDKKKIPFDLSMAFHTDAGTTTDDGIIGSLSVYTLMCDGSRTLPDGKDRMTGRELASLVQDQICDDIRADYAPEWNKRLLWDRSYSESRTTSVPGMLLELLSHQNLADMKYGLDPSFRFTVSRAIYKGMLKFLSEMYAVPYTVQPLPVNTFAVTFGQGKNANLSWEATDDPKEPTATPSGYIVYTRVDDGGFDSGVEVSESKITLPIEAGHIYSYKVVAFNDGGKSFPSEVLSIGLPEQRSGAPVLVVNNFDRVAAPSWFEDGNIAGFNAKCDGGVPYIREINYVGDNYQFRRNVPWKDDDDPGFGGSYAGYAGKTVAGNTFDFVYGHGKTLISLGRPFYSKSHAAFENDGAVTGTEAIDLICGKQVTTKQGSGAKPNKYQVFPVELQNAISEFTANGGNVIISGANIATDVWDEVYPAEVDSAYREDTRKFVEKVLGYKYLTSYGSYTGAVGEIKAKREIRPFNMEISEELYNVERVDGIVPANEKGITYLRYTENEVPAAVLFKGENYKIASFGFPIETLKREQDKEAIMKKALEF